MPTDVGSIIGYIEGDNSGFLNATRGAIDAAERTAKQIERHFQRAGKSISALGRAMSIAFTAPAALAAKAAKDTGLEIKRLETRMQFATGSAEAARKEIEFVTRAAESLGILIKPSIEGFSSFAAAAKGTSIEGDTARQIFLGLSKATATLNLSLDQTQGAWRALEQIMSKGSVQAEELRGQLGERIPGAFQIASRAMGKTTAELNKMLELGQVASDDFLPKFAAELQRTFNGAIDPAIRASNQFENTFFKFKKSISDSGVLEFFTKAKIVATTLMEQFIALDAPTRFLTIKIAAISAALGPMLLILGPIVSSFGALFGILGTGIEVLGSFTLGLIGAIPAIAGIALGAALILDVFGSLLPSMETVKKAFTSVKTAFKSVAEFFSKVIKNILGNTEVLTEGQQKAVEFIAKVWLSLKFAWNAIAGGLKATISLILEAMAKLITKMAGLAEFVGLEKLSKRLDEIASGLDGFSINIGNAAEENKKALQEIVDSWGDAPKELKKDVAAFKDAVQKIGEQALDGIKGLAPDAVEKVKGLIAKINEALKAGEAGAVEIPAKVTPTATTAINMMPFAPGTEEEIDRFYNIMAQKEFETIAKLAEMNRGFLEDNKSAWQTWIDENVKSLEKWGETAIGIFDQFKSSVANNLAATIVAGKSFGKSMLATFSSVGQQLIAMAIDNALTQIAISFAETKAKAAASAPNPILIPLFVGLAVAGFSAAMDGTIFSGSSGGGGAAAVSAPEVTPQAAAVSRIERNETGGGDSTRRLIVETEAGEQLLDVLVKKSKNGAGDGVDRFLTTADRAA